MNTIRHRYENTTNFLKLKIRYVLDTLITNYKKYMDANMQILL